MKKQLTPIPENWHHLENLHDSAVEKFGADAGFDHGGFVLSEEYTLKIAVSEGRKVSIGRKGITVRPYKFRYELAMFCPFTGLPLYQESNLLTTEKPAARRVGFQATLF